MTTYHVWRRYGVDNTLLYRQGNSMFYGVLGSLLSKGGADWKNGPVIPDPADLRPATVEDFHFFGVRPEGHIAQ